MLYAHFADIGSSTIILYYLLQAKVSEIGASNFLIQSSTTGGKSSTINLW